MEYIYTEDLDHEGNPERDHIAELRAWLKTQPQEVWYVACECLIWDAKLELADIFVDNPECDLGIIAGIFWSDDITYYLCHPETDRSESLVFRILENLSKGYYKNQKFGHGYTRYAHSALTLVHQSKMHGFEVEIPNRLMGPFHGIQHPYMGEMPDDETKKHLDEIFKIYGWKEFTGFFGEQKYHEPSDAEYFAKLYDLPERSPEIIAELQETLPLEEYVTTVYGYILKDKGYTTIDEIFGDPYAPVAPPKPKSAFRKIIDKFGQFHLRVEKKLTIERGTYGISGFINFIKFYLLLVVWFIIIGILVGGLAYLARIYKLFG